MSSLDLTVGLVVLALLGFRVAVAGRRAGRAPPAWAIRSRPLLGWTTPAAASQRPSFDERRGTNDEAIRPACAFADGPERPGFVNGDDDPMLTDEERVERAIADAGGQMRQQELLARSGWTKARLSRLLSSMADAGTVVKVRVGRENVVCLEDAMPDILDEDADESRS